MTPEQWAKQVGICQKTVQQLGGDSHLVPDHKKQEAEFTRVLKLALADITNERDHYRLTCRYLLKLLQVHREGQPINVPALDTLIEAATAKGLLP